MPYLIELNGERQLVESLDGYADWNVEGEDVPVPPHDHCALVDGAWVVDAPALAEAERIAAIRSQDPVTMHDELQARIAELEATVQVMGPMLEMVTGISLETGEELA